ncbi:MAG: P-type Cu+ transporter [Pseudonocardiales bacterium]|nr:P-type Cu+ transporter [Pseudonocardiales bacterium]
MTAAPHPEPTAARATVAAPEPEAAAEQVELRIGGMTCASCAARVQKKLNRLDGVVATVNYATEKATVSYRAPHSPEDLVAEVERAGYTAELPAPPAANGPAGPSGAAPGSGPDREPPVRLLVSAGLTLPVVVLSMVPAWQFVNWQWLSLALSAPVVVWGALPLHRAAWTNARHGTATMDTLVSTGVLAAFGWSLYALFWGTAGAPGLKHEFALFVAHGDGSGSIYLEVAAGVSTFILAGRFLEARSKRDAGAALRALLDLSAPGVSVLRGAEGSELEQRVPTGSLVIGDRFVVRPGEKIATDGVVEQGSSAIDTSVLTGESVPREVGTGSPVAGGSLNVGGRLVVRASRLGSDTLLARIAALVEQAQTGKASIQRLADRVAAVFVPIVIALAVVTFLFWLAVGALVPTALTAAVAVLVVACPCALGLATPTALLVGTGRGAQLGILIKGPEVLESTRRVTTVVLDKTGTLTTGQMQLTTVIAAAGEDQGEVLRLAGALEHASEHPVARAIARAARERTGVLPAVDDFLSTAGLGVTGRTGGHTLAVGRVAFLQSRGMALPAELAAALDTAETRAGSLVAVGWDGSVRGLFVVADTVKPTSAEAVRRLLDLGLTPILLTGDGAGPAQAVAREVGIAKVIAEVLPEDKAAVLRRLQAAGEVVAMVGDGVNDAAALATADLGLAMGSGTDAAIEAADLTLVSGDPRAVADAIRLSRRTLAVIRGNLFWAFAYNLAAIPIAATGLLNPMLAGAAMALSSFFVVSNSLRLRRFAPLRGAGSAES